MLCLNLKLNFQFELSYDRLVNLRFLSRYFTSSAGEREGSEETEIKILKWFVDNLEMIQHYRTHYLWRYIPPVFAVSPPLSLT